MAVDLGFVDDSSILLESRFFPSKIGGKPSWLDLKNIPEAKDIICDKCNKPRHFLCQIYCPFNEKDTAFHRTLFIFMCLSKDCFQPNCNQNFIVFRNQLPRKNHFYPDSPPVEELSWRPDINCQKFGVDLCDTCGIKTAGIRCESCGKLFCSSIHRSAHKSCDSSKPNRECLLPEYGLNIVPENDYSDEDSCSGDDTESEVESDKNSVMNDYVQLSKLATAQSNFKH